MTNAEYLEAVEKRHSRRAYRQKPLSPEIMQIIKEMVKAVNKDANLDFTFIDRKSVV